MKTKIITIFFSAILAGSFLFMGFNRFITPDYILKIDKETVSAIEFNQLFSKYKSNSNLQELDKQGELVAKINYINQLVNELALEKYLNEKISLSEKSIMTVLKKTLGENNDISEFSTSQFQSVLENLENDINKEIFINSLEVELFKKIKINEKLLKGKKIKVYKIKDKKLDITSSSISKYDENIKTYKIEIKKIKLEEYIKKTIINQEVINNYYKENIALFTKPKKFSYDQIIIKQENLSSNNYEDYNNENNILSSFDEMDKNKILPKVYNALISLNENEESEIIKIGNLNYILKLKEIKIEEVISKEKAKEVIIEKIVLKEINNIDKLELDKIDNKLIEKEYFYSDSFLFKENLNKPEYKIFENEESGVFIDQYNYYEYRVDNISNNRIPKEQKNMFIQRYINFNDQKKNEVKYYQDQDLQEIGTENINYFLRSLRLEDNNLTNEQLENIVLIKEDKPIKIVLENDIYILKYFEDYLVDSKQIQNLIINIFYNELLNSIKLLYEIEINSELLLQ